MTDKEQELLTELEIAKLSLDESGYGHYHWTSKHMYKVLKGQIAKLKSLGYIKLPEGIEEKIAQLLSEMTLKIMMGEGNSVNYTKQILSLIRQDKE